MLKHFICLYSHVHNFQYSVSLFVSVLLAGGGVLLVEAMLFENRRGPVMAQIFSLNMLVQAQGRERPPSEYTHMLNKTGFHNVQVCRTGKSYDAILAIRWAGQSRAASFKSGKVKEVELEPFKVLKRLGGGYKLWKKTVVSLSAHGSPVYVVVNPSDILRYCDYSSTCFSRIVRKQTFSGLRLLLDDIYDRYFSISHILNTFLRLCKESDQTVALDSVRINSG